MVEEEFWGDSVGPPEEKTLKIWEASKALVEVGIQTLREIPGSGSSGLGDVQCGGFH